MKHLRKTLAFVLTLVMAFAFALPALGTESDPAGTTNDSTSGSTITINRHSTWDEDAASAKATYTYYKIFDAAITEAAGVDVATGALAQGSNGNVVYTISGEGAAAKVAALPNIFKSELAADGNYYITLNSTSTTADQIVTALKTMVETPSNKNLFPGTAVTSDDDPVVLNVGSDGYYLILASNGKDAAVQTIGNVEINEKNDYPTVDKQQKNAAGTYADDTVGAQIGTYKDFQVTVHIPADATKSIKVIDTMTKGLQYDSATGLTLSPNVAYTALPENDPDYNNGAAWQIKFSEDVVQANRNSDIVITYRALVTADCLTDTGRENEVTLSYDDGNYKITDDTHYKTYFTGIEKVDGQNKNTKLGGVEFTLTVDGQDLKVAKPEGKNYYIPDTNGSATVVTDSNGLIIIRGLDNTKTYKLTETKTQDGYNLLAQAHTLTLVEDTADTYVTNNFAQIENNKGTQMPSTGGIGTTIFYVVGGVLVAGAVVFLLTKRRVADSE